MRSIVVAAAMLSAAVAAQIALAQYAPQPAPPAQRGNGVQLEIRPRAPPPAEKPPRDLGIPREQPTEPVAPAPEEAAPANDASTPPPPAAWEADEPPRGEGAAIIPRETPSGVKAIENWIRSWFE